MSSSLIDRFSYGNSNWPAPFTPEAEIVIETPRREREMLQLARQQVQAQKDAGLLIDRSNLAGAKMVAAEIEEQTQRLDAVVNRMGEKVTASITASADQITDAIDLLGDRICAELSEIRWQISQQNKTLEKILAILYKSRNNETRQLVNQGVRHYVNSEFQEAEERFLLALNYDTTDYQVLMNLAYIEIHKENPSQAFTYFKKALTLPEGLNSLAKVRILEATARLFYAQRNYNRAFSYEEKALKANEKNARCLYAAGVYAVLAGNKLAALTKLKQAITLEATFFAKAAIDPDLESIKQDVLDLLSQLSIDAESKARKSTASVKSSLRSVETKGTCPGKLINEIEKHIEKGASIIEKPAYSVCRLCTENMGKLSYVLHKINRLMPVYDSHEKRRRAVDHNFAKDNEMRSPSPPDPEGLTVLSYIVSFLLLYVFAGYFVTKTLCMDGEPWVPVFIFWPIAWVLSLPGTLLGSSSASDTFFAGFKGILLALLSAGGLFLLTAIINATLEKRFSTNEAKVLDIKQQLDRLNNEVSDLSSKISREETKIFAKLSGIYWR